MCRRQMPGRCRVPADSVAMPLDKLTSPLSSLKISLTLSPSTSFCSSSEPTQPSAGSGCQARVPTSYIEAMAAPSAGRSPQQRAAVVIDAPRLLGRYIRRRPRASVPKHCRPGSRQKMLASERQSERSQAGSSEEMQLGHRYVGAGGVDMQPVQAGLQARSRQRRVKDKLYRDRQVLFVL